MAGEILGGDCARFILRQLTHGLARMTQARGMTFGGREPVLKGAFFPPLNTVSTTAIMALPRLDSVSVASMNCAGNQPRHREGFAALAASFSESGLLMVSGILPAP